MSKIHDPLSAASAEMLAAAASQVRELIEPVRKDGQKFKLAYDGLSAGIDDASEAEMERLRAQLEDRLNEVNRRSYRFVGRSEGVCDGE